MRLFTQIDLVSLEVPINNAKRPKIDLGEQTHKIYLIKDRKE